MHLVVSCLARAAENLPGQPVARKYTKQQQTLRMGLCMVQQIATAADYPCISVFLLFQQAKTHRTCLLSTQG